MEEGPETHRPLRSDQGNNSPHHRSFGAYNLMNTSDIRDITDAYGSRWGYPNTIINPRLMQFGAQIDF